MGSFEDAKKLFICILIELGFSVDAVFENSGLIFFDLNKGIDIETNHQIISYFYKKIGISSLHCNFVVQNDCIRCCVLKDVFWLYQDCFYLENFE